jgi:1-acyl-sn-glycerol-3-phosphate acyltransferase
VPTPFYRFVGVVSWPLMRGLYRYAAHGVENLPAEGGFVLSANHTSNFDPWPLGYALWPRRQLYFMAKVELFNAILGPPLRAGGAFPVRRGEQDIEAIETAVRLCRDGKIVAMFPEGTRRTKGIVKKFSHKPRTGSDQGHRSPGATAEARGRVRAARRDGRSCGDDAPRRLARGDGAADGEDLRAL